MSHVKPLKLDEAPAGSKPLLKAIEEKFGRSLNLFNTLAYQPDVLGGVTQINDGIRKDLPDKYRELAYYNASQINGCEYCSHYHRQAAKKTGYTDRQLDSMDESNKELFDDNERAVLSDSQQLTKTAKVDDGVVRQLKEFLDDRQIVTLAATVGLANLTNRINHGLDIELP